jgi:hypothetical protein
MNLSVTRAAFEHVTLGYPVFLEAMTFLRENASPGAVVLGANVPQIHWYSNLGVKNIPEREELPDALRHSEWVVMSNFEPEQKPYVLGLIKLIPDDPTSRETAVFRDSQFITAVVRSDWLLRALERVGQ